MEIQSLADVLRRRTEEDPDWRVYTYLLDGESEEASLNYGELDLRARAIAARLQTYGVEGERILLLYPPGLEYITAIWGCFYAGAVPILAFPPRLNRPTPRVQAIVADAKPKLALTAGSIAGTLEDRFGHLPDLAALQWLASDTVELSEAAAWRVPHLTSGSLAFLQYTSGSTGTPKGVMVSHGNALHNVELMRYGFDIVKGRDSAALWLPIYHDMGLVGGILEAVYSAMGLTLLAPAAFLQKPVRWLQAISKYGATISGGPNFAYQLCADQVTEEQKAALDLSKWRSAFCGAEPIHAATLERFAEAFASCGFDKRALYPCYGMAETTLIVSGARVMDGAVMQDVDEKRRLVSSGRILPGMNVVIANPETRARCDGEGEIWVSGPSVAQGYWNRPDDTRATFQAYTADGAGPFLRTGDLGFMSGEELFVTGRAKDLIIIRGQNHYPQDIERTVAAAHVALRPDSGAAFSIEVDGEERLVVINEAKREHRRTDAEEIFAAIRTAIAEQHDLSVHAIVLLQPASIPKTSSGKIKRRACREEFLKNELKVVAEWHRGGQAGTVWSRRPRLAPEQAGGLHHTGLATWLTTRLAARLGVDPSEIDPREPFAHYGLDSARAIGLAGELETHLGRRLDPTLLYDFPTIESLVAHLTGEKATVQQTDVEQSQPIAIIGIGCRFPGADGPDAFWKLLRDGVDAISEVPNDRFDVSRFYDADPEVPGKISTRWGGFLDRVDGFDLQFFGMTQREAARSDPQQRLLLETAYEALEDAAQPVDALAGSRTGVFIGISTNDYGKLQWSDPELLDIYASTGNAFSIAANRLSYTFDFRGPSIAIDTACSSSLVAVHLACGSLARGECELAIAGGVNVILSPAVAMSYTKAGAMAKDGRCKTFDAAADGFVRGEGAGVVVLKPLNKAIEDGDPIYAVIRGSAVNQDGRTNGLMAPSRQSQEAVLREACARAGIRPGDVQYVEAHGTGTLLGDPIEARALGTVMGKTIIGSVKTNIGHLEAAAGVAGLIKTALALKHRAIPKSLHFNNPNPHIPFDELPLTVATSLTPWPEGNLYAGVSAFGFGGTNAHVVLSGTPASPPAGPAASRRPELIPISARSPEALAARAEQLRNVTAHPADLSYTLGARRAHHDHRMAIVGDRTITGHAGALAAPPVVFVYSGQGSQWLGMGRQLLETEPVFRAAIQEVNASLQRDVSWSLIDELTTGARLTETEVVQPAIFAIQVALTRLWKHGGIEPAGVLGHSSGEVAAAWAAGILTLDEAARWIVERGKRLQGATGKGRMAMVSLPEREAAALTGDTLSIAAINSPTSTVLSGDGQAVDEVLNVLQQRGVFCRPLRVDYAFHSAQVEPFLDGIEAFLSGLEPAPATIPFASTMTGTAANGPELDGTYWREQIRKPVRFAAAIDSFIDRGFRTFVEIGPHPVLVTDINDCLRARDERGTVLHSLKRGEDERAALLLTLGALYVQGQRIAWTNVTRGNVIPLPSYPWQRERCWLDVPASTAGWASTGGAGDHPLLGARLPIAHQKKESVWSNDLAVRRVPYLKDHRVEGTVVLPATAYLDMALSAAGAAGVQGAGVSEVRFLSPLLLQEDRSRQVQAVLSHDGDFRIFSRASGEAWTLHARGKVHANGNGNGHHKAALDEIRGRCKDEIAADDYYDQMRGRGLEYGPAFRGISKLWRGRGEALGQVDVPQSLAAGVDSYQIHPALLDACGQVLIAAEGEKVIGSGRSFLPMEIGELVVHGRPGARMYSHAKLRDFGAPGAESLIGDAQLLDEDGQVMVEAKGLRLRFLDNTAKDRASGPEDLLYELRWEEIASPNVTGDFTGTWILLADDSGLGAAVASRISIPNGRPVLVTAAEKFEQLGENRFTIRAANADDVKSLFEAVVPPGTNLRGVVQLWPLDAARNEVTALSESRGSATTLAFVRELNGRPWNELPKLWVVTRNAQPIGNENDLSQATLWGLGRTIEQEMPSVWGGLIDLDESTTVDRLLQRFVKRDGETQIAFRGDRTYAARISRARHLAHPSASMRWRTDASYLVTGGLGGLGLEVARWMVAQGARRLILLGRTALPPRVEWSVVDPSSRIYKQIAAIRELESLGASIHLASVDVADEKQVTAFLDTFRKEGWPAIGGIVHAAGVLQDQTILELDANGLDAVFRAKVQGAWLLHRLFAEAKLDFFVLFSSAASLLGSAGQANYAAANGFLDALAHHRRANGLPALSINWGPWAEVGMAAVDARRGQRLALRGIGSIPPEQGLEVLDWLLRGDAVQAGVLPMQWSQLFQVMPQTRNAPLLSALAREVEESSGANEGEVAVRRRALRDELRALDGNPLTERLHAILSEHVAGVVGLSSSRLDVHAPLNTLGIDSLLAVELKSRVENELGVMIPAVKLLEGPSIADLATVVRDQISSGGAAADLKAGAATSGKVPVTPIQPRGSLPPFLCIHPGALDVHCYDDLAKALGDDQPFFALTPPELDNYRSLGGSSVASDKPLEDVAASCVEAIRAIQPHGPYYLGGWSMGGILAFLAAQQLRAAGEEIALLAAFDSPAPPDGQQSSDHDDRQLVTVFNSFLGARRGQVLPLAAAELEPLDLDARFALLLDRAKEARAIPPDSGQSQIRFLFQVFKNGLLAAVRQLGQLEPKPFEGSMALFRVGQVLDAFDHIFPDVTSQWSKFTSEPLRIHSVPGDHYTMFLEPNVQVLAQQLRAELAAATTAREATA